jgi:hypothetical protein
MQLFSTLFTGASALCTSILQGSSSKSQNADLLPQHCEAQSENHKQYMSGTNCEQPTFKFADAPYRFEALFWLICSMN